MQKLGLLGWSFKRTPIEIREKLSIPTSEEEALAQKLQEQLNLKELLILSTCNRTEFYYTSDDPTSTPQALLKRLVAYWEAPEIQDSAYSQEGGEAIQHLFRVTSSLDSMVLGETQIVGQVKKSYQNYLERPRSGKWLSRIFPKAFSVSKRIHTETPIAQFAVSISFAAVELAKRIFEDLHEKSILVIGAGEMAELAVKHFMKSGVSQIWVTNRTFTNAVSLAESCRGSAIHFDRFVEYLDQVDIVISSTGAKGYVVTEPMLKDHIKARRGNPMFLIDIAVPRDIDPLLNTLSNTYVYDIDDLQGVVDQNRQSREQAAEEAQLIIEQELQQIESWIQSLSVVSTIRCFRKQLSSIGKQELQKTLSKLSHLSSHDQELVTHLMNSTLKKILHTPTLNLKALSQEDDIAIHLDTLHRLFELELPSENSAETPPVSSQKPHLRIVG